MTELHCPDVRDATAELALGILPADERGPVIAHLDGCRECQEYLRQHTAVGDQLLTLFPANEPPMGFEERVAARIGLRVPAPERRWFRIRRRVGAASETGSTSTSESESGASAARRRAGGVRLRGGLVLAGVAVVFGVGGVLGGIAVGPHPGTPTPTGPSGAVTPADAVVDAPLVAGSGPVGRFYAYTGRPSWIYLGVHLPGQHGSVYCELVGRDGAVRPIGWFPVTADDAYWGAPSPLPADAVAAARLVSADGTVVATATLGH